MTTKAATAVEETLAGVNVGGGKQSCGRQLALCTERLSEEFSTSSVLAHNLCLYYELANSQ